MVILVISNPVSGEGHSEQFLRENVLPLLENENLKYQLEETKATGDAGRLALDFLKRHKPAKDATILVSGGDGTIHEVINGIGLSNASVNNSSDVPFVIRLVICPQGTANAIYSTLFPQSNDEMSSVSYRLKSLRAMLAGTSRPIVLTKTELLSSDGRITETTFGVVVTSTALHAAILDSAEHLRASVPGIDRFKVAAAQNISTWYHGRVRLHPSKPGGHVEIFDPQLKTFEPLRSIEDPLTGPFSYFLSTINVDRLEPHFQISPLFTRIPPGPGELDLIIIRPLRDPSIQSEDSKTRENFVVKATAVLHAAYDHGSHVTLSYAQNGTVSSSQEGSPIVEYIRCGGWEWEPAATDTGAHMVCIDGTNLKIEQGGKATCEVIMNIRNMRFTACV